MINLLNLQKLVEFFYHALFLEYLRRLTNDKDCLLVCVSRGDGAAWMIVEVIESVSSFPNSLFVFRRLDHHHNVPAGRFCCALPARDAEMFLSFRDEAASRYQLERE